MKQPFFKHAIFIFCRMITVSACLPPPFYLLFFPRPNYLFYGLKKIPHWKLVKNKKYLTLLSIITIA